MNSKGSETSLIKRLDMLLLETPNETLREDLFAIAIEMHGSGMTQRETAVAFARARSLWSAEKQLGDQALRLEPLDDVVNVVCGFDDAPSPLFGTTLEDKLEVLQDGALIAGQCRAASTIAQGLSRAI